MLRDHYFPSIFRTWRFGVYTYRSLQSIFFQKTCISLLQSFVLRFSRSNLENKKIMVDQIIASFSMNFERKRNCTLNVPLTQTTSIILPNFPSSRSAAERKNSSRGFPIAVNTTSAPRLFFIYPPKTGPVASERGIRVLDASGEDYSSLQT